MSWCVLRASAACSHLHCSRPSSCLLQLSRRSAVLRRSRHPAAAQTQPWAALSTATHMSAADPGRGRGDKSSVADLVKGRDLEWRSTALEVRHLLRYYMELSKVRLTGLVVVTAAAGYAMAPVPFSATALALLTSGTLLTSAAANAINQWMEVPYDAQMARTCARPLVRGTVSPAHAMTFAAVCACSGIGLLYAVSPLAAALGAANLALYTAVYTPLKRVTIANTWVGAVVGGIPPLMGWAAAAGSLAPGAWLLAALLYAWQFPHFNALSWNLRKDYARAGYRITAVTHPDLCRRVALRYSLLLAALPFATAACDVTSWMYAVDTLPVNAYLLYLSWRFYRNRESTSARALTRFSYLQLTACLILMLLAKQHYHQEQHQEMEIRQQHKPTWRDWCIGEPLIGRGWNLHPLIASAERTEAVGSAPTASVQAVTDTVASASLAEEHEYDHAGVLDNDLTNSISGCDSVMGADLPVIASADSSVSLIASVEDVPASVSPEIQASIAGAASSPA